MSCLTACFPLIFKDSGAGLTGSSGLRDTTKRFVESFSNHQSESGPRVKKRFSWGRRNRIFPMNRFGGGWRTENISVKMVSNYLLAIKSFSRIRRNSVGFLDSREWGNFGGQCLIYNAAVLGHILEGVVSTIPLENQQDAAREILSFHSRDSQLAHRGGVLRRAAVTKSRRLMS